MANTKVPIELSSTPGIVDNSTATAITIDSAGAATFSGEITTTSGPINVIPATTTTYAHTLYQNASGLMYVGRDSSAGASLLAGSSAYAGIINVTGAYPIEFGTNNVKRMTLDASGNLLVGKSGINSAVAGAEIRPNLTAITSAGDAPLYLRRNTSDGAIINMTKDNTPVGLIGTQGGVPYISGPQAGGLKFSYYDSLYGLIFPVTTTGANADGLHDLGYSAARFRNLVLSGVVSAARATIFGPITNGNAGLVSSTSTASGDLTSAGMSVVKYDNNSSTSQVFFKFLVNQGQAACGQINANGGSQAAFGSWSDATLKENIVDLPDQYDNIRALRPVEFDYIESEGGEHQIGFIAQEMQEVYPCCVGERDDGKLTISGWNKTEARLVSALQSAMNKIEDLTARIEALEGA